MTAAFGDDQITDFTAGSASGHDVVQISHTLCADYDAILAASTQVGDSTVITYDANDTITLDHVAKSALVAADFAIV